MVAASMLMPRSEAALDLEEFRGPVHRLDARGGLSTELLVHIGHNHLRNIPVGW